MAKLQHLVLTDRLTFARLVVHLARVVPSAAAAPRSSLEWRLIRKVWLEALEEFGWSEAVVQAMASQSWNEGFEAALRDADPEGSA